MGFFRRIDRPTLLLWSLLLSLLLLCSQGATLHLHSLDHGQDKHLSHAHATDEASDHTHLSKAHYAHDSSHDEHHDVVLSEVDVSPNGVLKKLSNNTLTLALFALLFTLLLSGSLRQVVHRHRENRLAPLERYLLSPPLRAPPLR